MKIVELRLPYFSGPSLDFSFKKHLLMWKGQKRAWFQLMPDLPFSFFSFPAN